MVALARGFNDPSTLADTLADRGAALYGPDNPAERLAIAGELRAVARAARNKELELKGEDDRAMVLLETGRIAEYRQAIGALQRLAPICARAYGVASQRGPAAGGEIGYSLAIAAVRRSARQRRWTSSRRGPQHR